MDLQEFIDIYYITRHNKRRSPDSVEFELHYERNIINLINQLRDHTFVPSAYTFIATRPKPREVFACEMAMRVIHHYLDVKMRPIIETRLTDRTFNNRVGYGSQEAINTVISDIYEVTKGFTKDAWIIKMDLKGYFPNASQDIVYKQLSSVIEQDYTGADKDLLLQMLMISIFSYPTHHCTRKSRLIEWESIPEEKSLFSKPDGIGGAIGHLIWQNAMNFYLNDLDHFLIEECGLHYTRFVDDMVIVTDNKELTLAIIPTIRKMLADLGCTLHPDKFYCQHYSKGVEFIGSTIKRDRVYVNKRILRNAFSTIDEFNKRVRLNKLETFIASLNSYLGIFKRHNAHNITNRFISKINPEWWKYCYFDEQRVCVIAKEEYKHTKLICRKYNIKLKRDGRIKRKNRKNGIKNAVIKSNNAAV